MGHQIVARKALPVLALVLALSVPPAAQAQRGNPLSPGLPPSSGQIRTTTSPSAPITTPSTSTTNGGGIGGTSAVAITIGAVAVLGGISLFIWRDARRRAPVRQRAAEAPAGAGGRPGAKQRGKPRKLSAAEKRRRKRGRAR